VTASVGAEAALIPYDPVARDGDETVPPGEAAAIAEIVATIEAGVRAAAKTAPARRDAHVKAHGCVKAEFRVLDDLPDALRVGLFAAPRRYQAWVRFSNGNGTPQDDKIGDGRGMAVKVMGVKESPSTTQDFLMINNPAFFVRNAVDYVGFENADPQWRFFLPGWNPLRFRLHEFLVVRAITSQKVTNPLDARYWTMTPFLWGDTQAKFSARRAGPLSPFSSTAGPNFLRDNLVRHLAKMGAAFDFLVQRRTRPAAMPIEDPTIAWPESDAPFVPVARIEIPPQQGIDQPDALQFCENLSFTPWHGLAAHRPLGGINRVRRTVYETISSLRHQLNDAPRVEPSGF
jgi:hypothetical protein